MSQENVEIARRGMDALNKRDIDSLAPLVTADFEWFPAMTEIVEGGSFKGRAGLETYAAEIEETWEEARIVAEEFRDLGDPVLILYRVELRGRGSGVPVTASQTAIVDFCDRKISRSAPTSTTPRRCVRRASPSRGCGRRTGSW